MLFLFKVARIVLSGMGIDGATAGVGAGYTAYDSSEDEGPSLKRRKSERVDKKYFSKVRVDLQALLNEEDLSSGEDDDDWQVDEEGGCESEVESLVDSDEVLFSKNEDDDDWGPGSEVEVTTTEESLTESDIQEEDDILADDENG